MQARKKISVYPLVAELTRCVASCTSSLPNDTNYTGAPASKKPGRSTLVSRRTKLWGKGGGMWEVNKSDIEMSGTLNGSEKTTATPGDG